MSQYRGSMPPRKSRGRQVKINGSAAFTLVLVIAIVVLLVLIISDMKKGQTPGTQITDIYGGKVNTQGLTDPNIPQTPRSKRPVSDDPDMLPVFYSADTDEKEVAITITNAGSVENIANVLGLCDTYNARVTFFPTGKEVLACSNIWGEVIFGGHEIENHGYSGEKLSSMGTDGRRTEIGDFTYVLRMFVGEDYKPHFLRTNDLSDDENAAVHAILIEEGYYGIARWNCMSPSGIDDIRPGQIIAIDLGSYGVSRFGTMLSALNEAGYRMVTMNALFDYEENLVSSEGAPDM